MFQNIAKDFEETESQYEDVELDKKEGLKILLNKILLKFYANFNT